MTNVFTFAWSTALIPKGMWVLNGPCVGALMTARLTAYELGKRTHIARGTHWAIESVGLAAASEFSLRAALAPLKRTGTWGQWFANVPLHGCRMLTYEGLGRLLVPWTSSPRLNDPWRLGLVATAFVSAFVGQFVGLHIILLRGTDWRRGT